MAHKRVFNARNQLHLTKLLTKEAPWKPTNTQALGKAIGCCTQTVTKTLLLNTISAPPTLDGEATLHVHWSLHSY